MEVDAGSMCPHFEPEVTVPLAASARHVPSKADRCRLRRRLVLVQGALEADGLMIGCSARWCSRRSSSWLFSCHRCRCVRLPAFSLRKGLRSEAGVVGGEAAGVLVVGGFEELGGFGGADDGSGGEDFGWLAGFGETVSDLGLDGIDEQTAADGAAGGDGRFETVDFDHGIAHGRAGIEDDVGEVLELLALAVAAGAGLAVDGADDGGDLHAAPLKLLGHLDGDDIAAAAGDDEGAVAGFKVKVSQDAGGEATDVFEEHGLTLAIGPDDEVVKGEGELDDRIEAGEGAVTRPHFLDKDAAVAGAEDVDHLPVEDGLRKQIGGLLDEGKLLADAVEQALAGVEILKGRGHGARRVERGRVLSPPRCRITKTKPGSGMVAWL